MNTETQINTPSISIRNEDTMLAQLAQAERAVAVAKRELFEYRKANRCGISIDKKALSKQRRAEAVKTENGLTIHNLRKAGCKVLVSHIRFADTMVVKQIKDPLTDKLVEIVEFQPVPVPSYMRKYVDFNAKGGATYIVVEKDGHEPIMASSHCHQLDSFDYKMGVKRALDLITQQEADELLIDADGDRADSEAKID